MINMLDAGVLLIVLLEDLLCDLVLGELLVYEVSHVVWLKYVKGKCLELFVGKRASFGLKDCANSFCCNRCHAGF